MVTRILFKEQFSIHSTNPADNDYFCEAKPNIFRRLKKKNINKRSAKLRVHSQQKSLIAECARGGLHIKPPRAALIRVGQCARGGAARGAQPDRYVPILAKRGRNDVTTRRFSPARPRERPFTGLAGRQGATSSCGARQRGSSCLQFGRMQNYSLC